MAFSISNSWGPPVPKSLSGSDENAVPTPDEKPNTAIKNTLKTSGEKDKEPSKVLKISRENFPAAAHSINQPVITLPFPSYQTRFKLLESTTDLMLTGIEMAPNFEVDARFYNIPCIHSSRPKDRVTQKHRKLHANEVNLCGLKIICTQAPTPNTYSEFWNTICDLNAMIIDLTNDNDRKPESFKGDLKVTALPYYPQEVNEGIERDGITVTLKKIERLSIDPAVQFTCNEYLVKINDLTQSVFRVNFSTWNDFQGIKLIELVGLVECIEKLKEKYGEKIYVIHCRAGMGRTGTLSIALAMWKMHQTNTLKAYFNTASESIEKTVDQLILLGRVKRGKLFVSSLPQYILLHEYLACLLAKPSP